MAWQGIDLLQTGDRIVFRAFLQDSSGALITSGSATLKLYELQNDGTLKSYDWNDATFKTTALTTETQALTHRTGNNGGTNTGLWTYALTTLSGFTAGNLYVALINHSSASPTDQARLFQFGVSAAFDPYDAAAAGLTKFADIEADTNEMQGDLADGGRLDLILDAIAGDVENLDGAAMRGTDGANTTTPPTAAENRDAILDRVLAGNHDTASTLGKLVQSITEARLAELDPANLPADIDALKGVIVEKLDDTLEDNAGTFRFTAAALAQAPTGGGGDATEAKQDSIIALLGTPTDTDIATDLINLQTAVDAINVGTGDGARTVTVTVDDGTNPLQNATVRMTEGANTYRTTTDVNGQCTFNLDDATYTVAITKAGYSFAGSSLVVDGVETPTYSMTQISPTPSASPDQTTGYATYFDEAGDAEQSVTVFLQFVSFATSDTALAYDTKIRQATTDVNGYVEFTGLFRGAKYKVKRGAGKWVEFTAADAETTPLPVHIGKEVE